MPIQQPPLSKQRHPIGKPVIDIISGFGRSIRQAKYLRRHRIFGHRLAAVDTKELPRRQRCLVRHVRLKRISTRCDKATAQYANITRIDLSGASSPGQVMRKSHWAGRAAHRHKRTAQVAAATLLRKAASHLLRDAPTQREGVRRSILALQTPQSIASAYPESPSSGA